MIGETIIPTAGNPARCTNFPALYVFQIVSINRIVDKWVRYKDKDILPRNCIVFVLSNFDVIEFPSSMHNPIMIVSCRWTRATWRNFPQNLSPPNRNLMEPFHSGVKQSFIICSKLDDRYILLFNFEVVTSTYFSTITSGSVNLLWWKMKL